MKPASEIENIVRKMSFKAGPEMDKDLWAETLEARETLQKTMLAPGQHRIGRIIMKSPIAKLAAAAAVLIACAVGLSFWRTTGSAIALADVLARVEKAKAVRYTFYFRVTSDDPNGTNMERQFTELVSQEYGMRTTGDKPGADSTKSTSLGGNYFSLRKNIRIDINPSRKKYTRYEFGANDHWIEQMVRRRKSQSDPLGYLRRTQKARHESLGRSTIDGIQVEGFRTTDSNSLGFGPGYEYEQKLWVDAKTLLPVRLEETWYDRKSRTRGAWWWYPFQWDVPVDASAFEPAVPEGYTVTVVKMPLGNEQTAIQGLKQWVEFFGAYPERITDVYARVRPLLSGNGGDALPTGRLLEATKGLTEDEIRNGLLMPIRGLERFAFLLGPAWDRKDLVYYGRIVTPKDPDKVLMRWQLSDAEYRVIFGDLHAETVSRERLAELEKSVSRQGEPLMSLHDPAARDGNTTQVEPLMSRGADVNDRDNQGQTPLHVAARNRRADIAELLIAKGAGIEAKDNMGMTPLQVAARFGGLKVAELLIAKGADIEAKDNKGMTSMHLLCFSRQGRATAELLIAKGANVNAKVTDVNDGRTPLHVAAWAGNVEVAELLIAKGVDINARENDGGTPLHRACLRLGRKNVVELLIGKGADVNARDSRGRTPLSVAKETKDGEIVELLRTHGATE